MIYFTADNHFYHGNIIGSCDRPFANVNEMNKAMIDNWNSLITNNDEVYILGDFAYKASGNEVNYILSNLKGKKYLVKGNHEKYLTVSQFNTDHFEWIKDYYVLKHDGGLKLVLFHY